jgi:hypothetical protein
MLVTSYLMHDLIQNKTINLTMFKSLPWTNLLVCKCKIKWKCQCSFLKMYHIILNELKSKWKLCQCSFLKVYHVITNELRSKWKLCQSYFYNYKFRLSINKLIYQCSKYAFHELTFFSCKCKPKMKSSFQPISQVLFKHGFFFLPLSFQYLTIQC